MTALDDWSFDLPDDLIARFPAEQRDGSRLMRVPLDGSARSHHHFHALPAQLRPGDLLVANNTRVVPARLFAKRPSGGQVELLLLGLGPAGTALPCMAKPMRKLRDGEQLSLPDGALLTVLGRRDEGTIWVSLGEDALALAERLGAMPLPPYLGRDATAEDRERYQTVYAQQAGSAAAPTAGLHFTPALLSALEAQGIGFGSVTLHVGLGTFKPLRDEDIAAGQLHSEPYWISDDTATRIAETRAHGGRVIAIGTTTARALQAATPAGAHAPEPGPGSTTLFLFPPAKLNAVDGLITNFHLPRSSLLMLVACLTGRDALLDAYRDAVRERYRFYSYGDAMLLL